MQKVKCKDCIFLDAVDLLFESHDIAGTNERFYQCGIYEKFPNIDYQSVCYDHQKFNNSSK